MARLRVLAAQAVLLLLLVPRIAAAANELGDLLTPVPGSTLTESRTTFTWSRPAGVTDFWLDIGTSRGGYDLYSRYQGSYTIATISLPADGHLLWVRLWSRVGGVYYFVDREYRAAGPRPAFNIRPANGTVLAASDVDISWETWGLHEFFVEVYNRGRRIFSQSVSWAVYVRVTGLPTDGSELQVIIYSLVDGTWHMSYVTYTAATGVPSDLALPAPGSRLTDPVNQFLWGFNDAAQEYWLEISGGSFSYSQRFAATTHYVYVDGMPEDGTVLRAILYTRIDGEWRSWETTYTTGPPVPGAITFPPSGTQLTVGGARFVWSAGIDNTDYWLTVGSTLGADDIFSRYTGATREETVSLPADLPRAYVRVYSRGNDVWRFVDHVFLGGVASEPPAQIMSPPVASKVYASETFRWTSGGASDYWLSVGRERGGEELFSSYMGTSLAVTLGDLPRGQPFWVRLYSRPSTNAPWDFRDYVYDGQHPTGAAITGYVYPSGTSEVRSTAWILPSRYISFEWSPGVGVEDYWLDIGYGTRYDYSLYSRYQGRRTRCDEFVYIPCTEVRGCYVWVRIWSRVDGRWTFKDRDFKAPGPFDLQ